MPEAGVTLTGQRPASADVVLDADAHTVTELWARLLETSPRARDTFVWAVRELARDRTVPELYDALAERDVPYYLRSPIRSVAQGDRREAWRLVAERAPAVGSDVGTVEDLLATAGLLEAAGDAIAERADLEPLTVTLTLGETFRDRRREQREDVLALVARLAAVADVRILATGLTRRWLASEHRADLPGVSEECTDHPDRGPVSERVERALAELDPEGTPVGVLRRLADAPAETRAYTELYADPALPGDSRIRQVLGTLTDLGLIEPFGARSDRKVDLLDAGRELLARLDAEIGCQRTLEDSVSDPGKSSPQFRGQREHARPPQAGGEDGAARYTSAYLDRPSHAAAAGAAADGALTLAKDRLGGPEPGEGPDHTRYVSVDGGRDEAVVAVHTSGPLQGIVSSALALASPLLLDEALPPGRLADALGGAPAILRDARCIGALSDDVLEEPEAFRDAVIEWGEDLAALTTKLKRGEYDDRKRFRGEILRSAHGLAGTVAHVLDVAGVDVVREFRVPGGLDRDALDAIAKSLGVATAVQSRYGAFASYRQLFESRSEKRETALRPDVDATDPVGELIGSVVVRGPDVHRIEPALATHLQEPADVHEDAPEFAVAVPLREAGREEIAATAERVLGHKRLSPTPAAVSLLDGLVASPYDVASALHQLAAPTSRRQVRPSDLRYALGTLPAEALLEDLPPTLGAVVVALLRADPDRRLSTAELAERADVSTRSVRTHRETLQALDLVREDDADGWYVSIAPDETEGSDETDGVGPAYPRPIADGRALVDVVSDVAAAVLPPPEYADPDGPVSAALTWPAEPWALREDDRLGVWVELAGRLLDADPPDERQERTVRMGPEIEQTPLGAEEATDAEVTPV